MTSPLATPISDLTTTAALEGVTPAPLQTSSAATAAFTPFPDTATDVPARPWSAFEHTASPEVLGNALQQLGAQLEAENGCMDAPARLSTEIPTEPHAPQAVLPETEGSGAPPLHAPLDAPLAGTCDVPVALGSATSPSHTAPLAALPETGDSGATGTCGASPLHAPLVVPLDAPLAGTYAAPVALGPAPSPSHAAPLDDDPLDPLDTSSSLSSALPAPAALPTVLPAAPAPAPVDISAPISAASVATTPLTHAERVTEILRASAVELASSIQLSPTLATTGTGEIRIELKNEILDGSTIRFEVDKGEVRITLYPASQDASQVLQTHLETFQAQLAERVTTWRTFVGVSAWIPKSSVHDSELDA